MKRRKTVVTPQLTGQLCLGMNLSPHESYIRLKCGTRSPESSTTVSNQTSGIVERLEQCSW